MTGKLLINMKRWLHTALLGAMLVLVVPITHAQDRPALVREEDRQELQQRWLDAFAQEDYAEAERALKEHLAVESENFVLHYNLACARSMQGDADEAMQYLVSAVATGFSDLEHMRNDPHLELARTHPDCIALMMNWNQATRVYDKDHLAQLKKQFDGRYQQVDDESLRLHYLAALDPGSFEQSRLEISAIAAWAQREIFVDLPALDEMDPDDLAGYWVFVVLPTPEDFKTWASRIYGSAGKGNFFGVGGHYSHDRKELIAKDIGATLRHEFLHVLHWRSNVRHSQVHPVWIQEGLCSLIEDYDMVNGNITPVASWRTNIVKRLAKAHKQLSLTQLATLTRERFTGSRPLAYYAQARAFFLYLYEKDKLGAWYRHYVANFEQDPTGVASVVEVLGMPVDAIDADFREWALKLKMVPDQRRPGRASLGIDIAMGSGDGPVIQSITRRSVRKAGLRIGDVITAIENRPTRDLNELVRVLGDYEPDATIEISYRRFRRHGKATVKLIDRAP